MSNTLKLLRWIKDTKFKDPYILLASLVIPYDEAHNINGDYQLSMHQDPEEKDLVEVITKSNKVAYITQETYTSLGLPHGIHS